MLNNLQKKPEYVRKRWALIISLVVTFIIFLVWASTFSINIGDDTLLSIPATDEYSRYGSIGSIYLNIKRGITEIIIFIVDLF